MISVEVKYVRYLKNNDSGEDYIYPYFKVSGHANKGDSYDAIKCCASVTACLLGVAYKNDLKVNKGEFIYSTEETDYLKEYRNKRTLHKDLDLLLYQLHIIKSIYPLQFSKFETTKLTSIKRERKGDY